MPTTLPDQLKNLTDKCERLQKENEKLHTNISVPACIGLLVVTFFCGFSVLYDTLNKPEAFVLVTATICWAGLVAVAMTRKVWSREDE